MTHENINNKEFLLDLIKLLSALESWSFSTKERIPDYLSDTLNNLIVKLSVEVLK